MCLLVDMTPPHVIAAVADQYGAFHTRQRGQLRDKAGVAALQAHVEVQLDAVGLHTLALDGAAARMLAQEGQRAVLTLAAAAGEHGDERLDVAFPVDEQQQHQPDDRAADDGQRDQPGGQHDAGGHAEQTGDLLNQSPYQALDAEEKQNDQKGGIKQVDLKHGISIIPQNEGVWVL